ncbi:MAG TPA: dihydropteroate synthase [Phycisphaerae bacterium]|nr:dihydropteroate synthase [Phycisphaerae bacterium]
MRLTRWNPRVVEATNGAALAREMRHAGAPPESIAQVLARTGALAVALEQVDRRAADRLEQEMRAMGGDVARCAAGGELGRRATDLVLVGNRRQFETLRERLHGETGDLAALGFSVADALERHARREFELVMGAYRLSVGERPLLMGVVNVTPDSFSDGGKFLEADRAVAQARRLVDEGADLLDIGGESTRPGSESVPETEEMRRVLPVVETLAEAVTVPLSIDTRHARVAREAVAAGAALVNDVTGLQGDPEMARAVAETGAGVVIMHILGEPKTMQQNPHYDHLMADVVRYLRRGMALAQQAGVPENRILVDPGIGFGKTLKHNLEILAQLGHIRSLGRPILVGPSRKRFLGELTGVEAPAERTGGTAAACALAVAAGALVLRVHDVAETKQTVAVAAAIARADENGS